MPSKRTSAPEITDEGKAYRVMCWLDSLLACSTRLRGLRAELDAMREHDDGVRAVRYDRPRVSRSANMDALCDRIAEKDEAARRLSGEASELEGAVHGAERAIGMAWLANRGVDDRAFKFVIERYARGAAPSEAAKSAGLGRFEAKLCARRVAPMIFDSAPWLFSKAEGDETGYYGYWESMGDYIEGRAG